MMLISNLTKGNHHMTFQSWLDTFIEEKGLDLDQTFTVQGPVWGDNIMSYRNIYELMLQAPKKEQDGIKAVIVKIDFHNGDVLDYFRHLAKAVAL